MEWHEAVGAASAILTFVSFSYEAIKVFREVLDKGSTAENDRSVLLATDSEDILDTLGMYVDLDGSDHARQISILARACQDDGNRLVELLDKLRMSPVGNGGSSPPRKSVWRAITDTANRTAIAARSVFSRDEISAIEERLRNSSNAIVLRLTALLSERQLGISLKLETIRAETQLQSQDLSDQMTSLGDALAKLSVCQPIPPLVSKPREVDTATLETEGAVSSTCSNADFERRSAQVGELLWASSGPSPEMRILKQLYFPSMYDREDHMRSAEEGTFEWLLTSETKGADDGTDCSSDLSSHCSLDCSSDCSCYGPYDEADGLREKCERDKCRSSLINWLRNGHGILHVVGKAGAGKSTLMKLLIHHRKVQEELQHWAGGKTLLSGHFFFWRAGTKMQSSLEGLFRSILFETLSKSPELVRHVFPEAYRKFSRTPKGDCIEELYFRPEKLTAAARKLVTLSIPDDCRLCLFIDGLDEYGEDARDKQQHEDLARLLSQWSKSDRVKLIVSSRPEKEFTCAFSNPDQRITLHELTRHDIWFYALQSLRRHQEYNRISSHGSELAQEVASRAEGVFVWAKFAIDTIRRALRDGLFQVEKLFEELEGLPDEMDEIYVGILKKNKSARERRRACWLLQAVCNTSYPRRLHPLFVLQIDHWHDPTFPFSFERIEWTKKEAEEKMGEAVSRVNGLAGGLVEVVYPTTDKAGHPLVSTLEPFHRTLRDFVFGSPKFAAGVSQNEKTYGREFYARISFTNVWFCCSDISNDMNSRGVRTVLTLDDIPDDILHTVLGYDWACSLLTKSKPPELYAGRTTWMACSRESFSYRHWAVFTHKNEAVRDNLAAWTEWENDTIHADNLSLVLSAALNKQDRGSFKQLLGQSDPNQRISLSHQKGAGCGADGSCPAGLQMTLWTAFCLHLGEPRIKYAQRRTRYTHDDMAADTIRDFINAGADCDLFIIYEPHVRLLDGTDCAELGGRYAVSLRDVILVWSTTVISETDTPWRDEFARLLEVVEVTMPSHDEWARYDVTLAGKEWMMNKVCEFTWNGPVGLGKGIREPRDDSVSLEITWTREHYVRIY